MRKFGTLHVMVVLATGAIAVGCGPHYTDQEIADAAERLRELYFLRDYERGRFEGMSWADARPTAFEPRAWYVANLARFGLPDSAVANAKAMVRMDDESPWGWFALAASFNRFQSRDAHRAAEATEASLKVLAHGSTDPFFLWLHAEVLRHYDHDTTAINFLDSLPPELSEHPMLLARRGEALFSLAYRLNDPGKKEEAQAAFARARAADSLNLEALHLAGEYLVRDRRIDEALPLLDRAVSLSDVPAVHDDLWYATLGRDDLTEEEKNSAIEADARALLDSRGDLPRTLRRIAGIFGEIGLETEQKELEENLLQLYPTSLDAELLLTSRKRSLERELNASRSDEGVVDSTMRDALIQSLTGFVQRPHHHAPYLLGEAYEDLFSIVRDDSAVSDEDFYEIVAGMVEYQPYNPHTVYAGGATALAERGTHFEEAARIARLGVEAGRREVDENKSRGIYDTEGEYERSLHYYLSMMADALGWVYYHEDRFDDAENELVNALEFSPSNRAARYHLGQLYETRAQIAADGHGPQALRAEAEYLDASEEQYMRGVMAQGRGANPNEDALKSQYEKTHGGVEGYETYRANIEEIDRERRRDKVLGERIADPTRIEPFSLNTLAGDVVSSEDIQGAVVVINFWNTSCGPCVAEMPELQQFHERYRSDPGVVVLTVSNDLNHDDVREWMDKNEYDFTVLLDDGYMDRVGVNAYPTTWFIDAEGRILFSKLGWSDALDEEFGWRVEELRRLRLK